MAETPDTNHEQVIQETEKAREHQSIPQTIEDFRKTANQRSAEHQKAAEAAVNKVEVFLNGKIMAEMETYKSFKEYADAPDKNKAFDAHLAKLTQRSAQRFNEGPLGKYLEASSDGEMVTIKLKAAPASAPTSAPVAAPPASPDKPAAPVAKPKETSAKANPDQAQLDAVRAKLGQNTQRVLGTLSAQDQVVAVRALAAMPADQAKIETFLGVPANAGKVKDILKNAGVISAMTVDALLPLMGVINKPTPQQKENADLLLRFAKTILHAQKGPITGTENLAERPEPKDERERLQFEIDDCLAIIKDPTKSTLDKIGAAMTAFGNMMTMIMGMATKEGREMLKGPPQKKEEKKKDDKKSEIAGPPKPADTVSRAPSTPATTSRSRENLAQKATEKGRSSLKAYHDDLKTEAAETKNRLESGKTVLATAEASEKNLTDRVAALEKQIIEKGSDERMVIILKGQLASAKGELATATEWVKQGRDEVKKAEAKYKQVSDDLKEVDTFVARTNDTATKLSAAMKLAYQSFGGPDYTLPAYAVALRPFFEGTSLTVDRQTYEVSLIADIPADRPKALQAFRSFAGKAGLPMDEAGTGMDGNGVITNPEAFTNAVQKIAQYLREEHDEKPKRIEKAGKEYVEKIPNVVARSSGGRINYVIKEPNSSPETSLYVIFDTSINQWTWGQPKNGVIDYKQVGFAINPADSDSDKALYTKYNTYITELAKINDDRRAGGASAPSAAPSTPVSAPSAAPSAPASAPAPTVSDTSEPAPTMSSAPASPREDPDAKLDNAVKEARANLEARGMEYMTALGFVRAQEGSPYMKPQNGPIKNYPMVVLTDGWKVFMSSSVGGMTDPSSITPEQALQSFSLNPERKSFMENLVKLNAEYRATVEKAKQERRAQS